MALYETLFPKAWYWYQPRKTLKCETVFTLNLVKNYQAYNRKCSETTLF